MYDPKIARFLQEDTYLGDPNDPLSLNLYTYCFNNPITYDDPTGHAYKTIDNRGDGMQPLVVWEPEQMDGRSYGPVLTKPNTSPVQYYDMNPAQDYARGMYGLGYLSQRYYDLLSGINYYKGLRSAGKYIHDSVWRDMPLWEKKLAELEMQALGAQAYMFNNRNSYRSGEFDISAESLYYYTKNNKVIPPSVLGQMKESYIGSDSFRRKIVADEDDLIFREHASEFLDNMVGVSTLKSALDLILGEDSLTGKEISTLGYITKTLDAAGLAFGVAKGVKALKYLGHADEIANAGKIGNTLNHVDDADSFALRPSGNKSFYREEIVADVKAYHKEYFDQVGDTGDNIDDLIKSATKRNYQNRKLIVKGGKDASYKSGTITYGPSTKRWEFLEEFLHYKVDNNQAFSSIRKNLRTELKYSGVRNGVGYAAEEIAVKSWLLKKANLFKLDEATQTLLKKQIEQLRRYGANYGY
ncbi:MAG: hypothetical protein N2645_03690 [Clostridia bacterium]|nr:hypothetical protein [Clostridia bacterium]